MKSKRILIITQEWDLHADIVLMRLRERGHDPFRLHPYEFPLSNSLTIAIDQDVCSGHYRSKKRGCDLNEIDAVYWRKPLPNHEFPAGWTKRERAFARMEVGQAMAGLWQMMDCNWMSHPTKIRDGSNKPEQLKRAVAFDLQIPRTLITNEPEAAQRFYDTCDGRVIYKVLSDPSLSARSIGPQPSNTIKCTYTTILSREQLADLAPTIRNTPCQFQEYIEKRLELRVTVVGDEVFTAEIDSQAQRETSIDWRYYQVPMILRPGKLPADLESKVLAYVRSYGLSFSAMDFVVTPEGEHVFLENNPNGNWYFVERHLPQFRMVDAVVDVLTASPATGPCFAHRGAPAAGAGRGAVCDSALVAGSA